MKTTADLSSKKLKPHTWGFNGFKVRFIEGG